jgi:hypothetical protein
VAIISNAPKRREIPSLPSLVDEAKEDDLIPDSWIANFDSIDLICRDEIEDTGDTTQNATAEM